VRVKQALGDALAEALDAVAEFGGPDRYELARVLGRETYDSLMSKQRTADLIDRWLKASPRTKPAATRALALGIARHVDDPSLTSRVESEISEAFGTKSREPTRAEIRKHREAQNQRHSGQRTAYEKPHGVNADRLSELARLPDLKAYIEYRRG
jgi:hypothetical protein